MGSWQETSTDQAGPSPHGLREVWITGVGLVSSLGSGIAAHWDSLSAGTPARRVDCESYAPYPVHRLADIPLQTQIPNKADLRQMGRWQQIGTYAAGLALEDAKLKGDAGRLPAIDLVVAAGNGERDETADAAILRALDGATGDTAPLIAALQTALRPTLYLAELSNLLAGNISIVHGVTKSSRTYKGEEQAGLAAFQDATARISGGTSRIALVGGACNAERSDLHLSLELCRCLWHGDVLPVRQRAAGGGGLIPGSIGAFVVLEEADHARERGVRPYARVSGVASARTNLSPAPSDMARSSDTESVSKLLHEISRAPVDILSGASGVEGAMDREMAFIDPLEHRALVNTTRYYGDALGHGMEAHLPAGIALASIALARRRFYPPFDGDGRGQSADLAPCDRILVTGFGYWRGAGAALLEAVEVA